MGDRTDDAHDDARVQARTEDVPEQSDENQLPSCRPQSIGLVAGELALRSRESRGARGGGAPPAGKKG
ncbi:hypothetical protein, partial [Kitasatospora sp. NPDC058402]|uniref:hypothetical protein n=1 Tax=Kitasatospora sp. NPDC058402 TaxID=3346481 RepID=UPI00365E9D2C